MASSLTYSLEGRQAGLSAGHDFQQPASFTNFVFQILQPPYSLKKS